MRQVISLRLLVQAMVAQHLYYHRIECCGPHVQMMSLLIQAVVEQHWRQEEDGSYIVFMHSVRHHAAREAAGNSFSWYLPIRAEVSSTLIC